MNLFKEQSSSILKNEYTISLSIVLGGSLALYMMKSLCCSSKKSEEDYSSKTALIIGGGIAGCSAIAGLRKQNSTIKIILIEPKDHCEIYWATYRSPFEDWVANDSLILLKKFCKKNNVQHVRDKVIKLAKDKATLENGTAIAFDTCCIATGADAFWPAMGRGLSNETALTKESRLAALKEEGESILKENNHVVIIGGGLIGTELAGDIAAYSKLQNISLKVTLIHSGKQLCPVMSEGAARRVYQQLESLGVRIYLDEKAEKLTNKKVKLLKSEKYIEDATNVIMTIGYKPMNDFVKENFSKSLNAKGWIETNDYFQLKNYDDLSHIFAMGDCTTTLPNAGNQYMSNVDVIGYNMNAIITQKDTKLKEVYHRMEAYCNTTGPHTGVFYSSLFWTQYLLPLLKNKTMFLFSAKDMVGLEH